MRSYHSHQLFNLCGSEKLSNKLFIGLGVEWVLILHLSHKQVHESILTQAQYFEAPGVEFLDAVEVSLHH